MSTVDLRSGFETLPMPHKLGKEVEVKQAKIDATGVADVKKGDVVITVAKPGTNEVEVYNVKDKAAATEALKADSVSALTVKLASMAMKP